MPDLASRMFERYGPTMTLDEIASAIHRSPKAIRNDIYSGQFAIATFRSGRQRLGATDKVAAYIADGRRTARARTKKKEDPEEDGRRVNGDR